MKRNKTIRLVLLGLLTWVVPFVVSFGFYDRTGNLNVSYGLFKCVMIIVLSITGMFALHYHLRFLDSNYLREGFKAGIVWLIINLCLDVVILVPMAGISYGQYFATIGLGYLQIPVMCIAVGMILQHKFLSLQKS
jgi:hypothetical protein